MLMDLIQNKYRIISVVGMAKNAGKTTTLNQLIDEAMDRSMTLGITSTGRDGEKKDVVTNTEKPLIYVEKGTLIATTEETFMYADATLELLEITTYHTALGRIIIARAVASGNVQVAGPSTSNEIKAISEKMLEYGAQLVIVDGAIDRIAAASPAITEATILATGAVLSRDMDQVIERSLHQIKLFSLQALENGDLKQRISKIMDEKGFCTIDKNDEIYRIMLQTALNGGTDIADAITEDTRYVALGGALVTGTLKQIMEHTDQYKNVVFVVKDATRIFIQSKDWQYFMKSGFRIEVIDKIHPLAVTVNPYAPQGYYFNPKEFQEKLKKMLYPIPVFDVMRGDG
ncbi:MAG: hypothetical protein KGZ33_01095 [Alkaliphilus sp.]|nr:hypothetical protein [Alkaliphilus sp.]